MEDKFDYSVGLTFSVDLFNRKIDKMASFSFFGVLKYSVDGSFVIQCLSEHFEYPYNRFKLPVQGRLSNGAYFVVGEPIFTEDNEITLYRKFEIFGEYLVVSGVPISEFGHENIDFITLGFKDIDKIFPNRLIQITEENRKYSFGIEKHTKIEAVKRFSEQFLGNFLGSSVYVIHNAHLKYDMKTDSLEGLDRDTFLRIHPQISETMLKTLENCDNIIRLIGIYFSEVLKRDTKIKIHATNRNGPFDFEIYYNSSTSTCHDTYINPVQKFTYEDFERLDISIFCRATQFWKKFNMILKIYRTVFEFRQSTLEQEMISTFVGMEAIYDALYSNKYIAKSKNIIESQENLLERVQKNINLAESDTKKISIAIKNTMRPSFMEKVKFLGYLACETFLLQDIAIEQFANWCSQMRNSLSHPRSSFVTDKETVYSIQKKIYFAKQLIQYHIAKEILWEPELRRASWMNFDSSIRLRKSSRIDNLGKYTELEFNDVGVPKR